MRHTSLVGVASTVCKYLGVVVDESSSACNNSNNNNNNNNSGALLLLSSPSCCPSVRTVVTWIAMMMDAVDILLDVMLIFELHAEAHTPWAVLMAASLVLAHAMSYLYEPVVEHAKHQSSTTSEPLHDSNNNNNGMLFYYHFGISECIVFLIEDTATIFLFAVVEGAYDTHSLSDKLNLLLTLWSAGLSCFLIVLGGTYMIRRQQRQEQDEDSTTATASRHVWIPNLAMVGIAHLISTNFQQKEMTVLFHSTVQILVIFQCVTVVTLATYFVCVAVVYVIPHDVLLCTDSVVGRLTTACCVVSVLVALALSLRSPMRRRGSSIELEEEGSVMMSDCAMIGTTVMRSGAQTRSCASLVDMDGVS